MKREQCVAEMNDALEMEYGRIKHMYNGCARSTIRSRPTPAYIDGSKGAMPRKCFVSYEQFPPGNTPAQQYCCIIGYAAIPTTTVRTYCS